MLEPARGGRPRLVSKRTDPDLPVDTTTRIETMMRITRGIATLSVAGLALAGLTACSSDDADKDTSAVTTTDAAEETTEASEEPSEEPTEEESEEATDCQQ